ncbi:MAG: hypothetical protein KC493_05770 [Bacteriovoracaceae bacterium]|nr:hypothetical protein [Bacteriovoracaceae bacterium]
MIEIGKINKLIVSRETKSGYYLTDEENSEEVFLPPSMGPIRISKNEEIEVFVYLDTQGKLIATSNTPFACVGEYARMKVIGVEDFGAFFDWGIEKDLLVPGNEQKIKVKMHEDYIVRVCLEEGTNRVYGTTKLGKYIESSEFNFKESDKVKFEPVFETELGFKIIINRTFIGMIYSNEIYEEIRLGKFYEGTVKKIREDGLVDVSLQSHGVKNLDDAKSKILTMLEEEGGKSPLYDKSSPAEIKAALSMSKNTFKSAIGMLYKDKKIIISKSGIELIKS